MGDQSLDWNSFWDVANPRQAARALTALYGADAEGAAAHCAQIAESDGRSEDQRFWLAALDEIRAVGTEPPGTTETAGPPPGDEHS
ncbi:hypothetical protein HBA54_17790 [Pelagibius litoralis]|uniref:Uncharacterized protein n=1 Tax=Pelagibius litoralis TaxID=374515 RepID=A0A967K8H4_9PROT|nr:hypothetical protein [Pelagibius litoralis]NIA70453.1 hypothetical protein [Pelagibius litoralis]